ncbi:inhibitor of growth proteins N-terminal histone-binding-domain-containing protein [Schizothecium vesticola]|uniref:Chromatin modification-related protein n=1 Tax=Schizothecium vesticola TaxID=314040 RepID=A0AA40K4W2_9PEZI|nr:inhibitor of growth proteins N-terminal histone-binding-domain-containing protein [Schizothecium vesticola]
MPRDDLSIDFVRKMAPPEAMDPALILDEWINRTQNLPEEVRFLQDEIAEKDRIYDKLVREIDDRDARLQKYIKAHGSHHPNPKEDEYGALIRKNFAHAERLADEKLALVSRLQHTLDKHVRQLDVQLKLLYDRNEPGFTDPDELPSLLRPSPANLTPTTATTATMRAVNANSALATALHPIITNATQPSARTSTQQIRSAAAAAQQHASASAPASPAASMIMNRQARELSAGPSGAPKRGPRANLGLNIPTTSSGLARHSSLGPGTPKGQHPTATGSVPRAGSAGPRANSKGAGLGAGRKVGGTPASTAGRKKGTPASAGGNGPSKSGLSRVKRAAKNSPSSAAAAAAADSELSDADSASADESDARGTPAALSRSVSNQAAGASSQTNTNSNNSNPSSLPKREGSHDGGGDSAVPHPTGSPHPGTGPRTSHHGPLGGHQQQQRHRSADEGAEDDVMDVDDDDAGDDNKYCLCQRVSFGDMVACDNDKCPYEWFHWSCVGLKSEPNGTWYCPRCTDVMMKKKGRAGS